jgi:hypothetical protein
METIKIELKNKSILPLLRSLEKVKLIRLLPDENHNKKSMLQLKGAISKQRAIELAKRVDNSRSEWEERTI